jgi:hypothetical protein
MQFRSLAHNDYPSEWGGGLSRKGKAQLARRCVPKHRRIQKLIKL